MNSDKLDDEVLRFLASTGELAGNPTKRWQSFLHTFQHDRRSESDCRQAWNTIFGNQENSAIPAPCWVPDDDRIAKSNLKQWMDDTSCQTVPQLHHWSATSRDSFWEMALETLEIAFRTAPHSIFDLAHGVTEPGLLPGARMNICESCFLANDDQVAVIEGTPDGNLNYFSYRELKHRANQVARALEERGLDPGNAIGVVMPLSFESVAVYLGIIQAGMVVVSIADSFAAPEISNRLSIGNAKAVFACESLTRAGKKLPLGERVREATSLPILLIDQPEGEWIQLVNRQPIEFEPMECLAMDPVNILFSSGTTGDPKAIVWNHATPIKCAVDGHLHHDLHAGDVVAWPTNLGWMMGPWLIFASLINRGTIALYQDAPFGTGFGRFVQNAGVNMLGVVPSMVRQWRADRAMESCDWSAIRTFSSTGESSNPDDMFYLSWLAGFRPIIEYCGGTEIGGGYISSTVVQPNAPSTFSTPAFGLDFRILDDNQQPADEGELFLIPPSIGLSTKLLNRDHHQAYYGDTPSVEIQVVHDRPAATVPLRRHGDYMRKLPGGYFTAGGRADDTMNLGGIKVSSVEIEKVLNELEEISESAAVAIPLERSGPDQLVVFYVPATVDPEPELPTDELLKRMNAAIRARLNPLFKIREIIPRKELPRTASNKVMRRMLRAELLQDRSAS